MSLVKLTTEQRYELLHLQLGGHSAAAQARAIVFGVSKNYPAILAFRDRAKQTTVEVDSCQTNLAS